MMKVFLFNLEKTMQKFQSMFVVIVLVCLALSACGAETPTPDGVIEQGYQDMLNQTTTPAAMSAKPTNAMPMENTPTPETMSETPAWFGATLTDAHSGQTFSINTLKGKVVLVEMMAQWCSNCRQQQGEVRKMRSALGARDDFATVALDIDPNENATDLKNYVEKLGFDWLYAVPPKEAVREIGNLYTAQFLNPPSTPILIVDRKGMAHPLPFGIKSADDLSKAVGMYLDEP
jgi:cytochrome oxidase Cu insertion factor (SCO1/SenC/PrrC family)